MKRGPLFTAILLIGVIGCSDGRPDIEDATLQFKELYPMAKDLSVEISMDEVIARSFRFDYRLRDDPRKFSVDIQFMRNERTGKWEPDPAPPKDLVQLIQNQINDMVALKITSNKKTFSAGSPVGINLQMVGFPGRAPTAPLNPVIYRICINPELNDQTGFSIILKDEAGNSLPVISQDLRQRKITFDGVKAGEQRIFFRAINKGVLASAVLPLDRWFDLSKPGRYSVRIQYKVFEASTRWTGPTSSNVLEFLIE